MKSFCRYCGLEIRRMGKVGGRDYWVNEYWKVCKSGVGGYWHTPLTKQENFETLYNKLL